MNETMTGICVGVTGAVFVILANRDYITFEATVKWLLAGLGLPLLAYLSDPNCEDYVRQTFGRGSPCYFSNKMIFLANVSLGVAAGFTVFLLWKWFKDR